MIATAISPHSNVTTGAARSILLRMDHHPVPPRAWLGLVAGLLLAAGAIAGADSTNVPAPSNTATNPIVIPFEIRRGHIMLPARVNGSDLLPFMLDTGYGMTMLRPGHAEELSLRRTGRVTIVGIAGEEPAGVFEGPRLDFGGVTWTPRRVAAYPISDNNRSHQRNGILGSGFFKRFVVEIDSRAKNVLLHEPVSFKYEGAGEVLPLKFKDTTPIIEAAVVRADQTAVPAQFEIDTGCDSCLCLGRDFADAHSLLPTNAPPSGGRSGIGGGTRTRPGRLPQLQLGNLSRTNLRANFFLDGSPVETPLAGHIGLELLRDYRVIFDYSRSRMILEPASSRQASIPAQ
jgi:predicted aspartyl protease